MKTNKPAEISLSEKIIVNEKSNPLVYGMEFVSVNNLKKSVKKILEKEFIMQFPKGAINGRGGEFVKVVEVKIIRSEMGDKLI